MVNHNKNSLKLKMFALLGMTALFIPVSYFWHDTLTNFQCKESTQSNIMKTNSISNEKNNCINETNFHWIAFYSINGAIYSLPCLALVFRVRKNNI